MKKIRFTGGSMVSRTITPEDLEAVGLSGEGFSVPASNYPSDREVEVEDEVANYLVERDKFELVDEVKNTEGDGEPVSLFGMGVTPEDAPGA